MTRKIILNLAMSLDGYIANEDGGFNWIQGDGDKKLDTDKKFNFPKFLANVDTIVMGRKAYDDCSDEDYSEKQIIIASSQDFENFGNVEFIKTDICDYIQELKKKEGKDIWLFGGGVLVDAFIKANIIDEYIVGIIPTILGSGRPLFLENNPTVKLHLVESTVQEGIPILRYTKRA